MLIQADARAIPLRDGCVQCVVTSPPYFGLRDYGVVGQIGAEERPDDYIAALVAVGRDLRRVLHDRGVWWLNLGDSYANGCSGRREGASQESSALTRVGPDNQVFRQPAVNRPTPDGWKPKDLLMIPARVALALQADGWYLRSDVIWSKPNPMPESVTDRPTKAHEYLFLLSKSEKYFYDQAAIYEPYAESTLREVEDGYDGLGLKDYAAAGVQNPSDTKRRIIESLRRKNDTHVDRRKHGVNEWDQRGRRDNGGELGGVDMGMNQGRAGVNITHGGRNRRTVWTIPTMPYAGAHFATMPEKLVEPCILAGSRLGDLVFDPFSGSGTVLAVAERLGRRGVGTDLNPAYHALAKQRTAQRGLRWTDASAAQAEPEHP